jgi:hypothetical protein
MFRRLISAVAVLALAGVVSTASAQDSSAMKSGVIVKPTYQVFVSSLEATPTTITALKARPAITAGDVILVNVRDFPEGQNDSTFVAFVQPHQAHIVELQGVLATQAEVKGLLEKNTPALSTADVVAVGTQENGKLLVFYRPKGGM